MLTFLFIWFFFIVSHDTIALGGTRQLNDDNTRVDLDDKDGIWQRCLRLCPSLAVSLIEIPNSKLNFFVLFSKEKSFGIG